MDRNATESADKHMARNCPYCGGAAAGPAFPFATCFADQVYRFWRCAACRTHYIDPVPDEAALARMYAKEDYHDRFYGEDGAGAYHETAQRLSRHLPKGSRILDYGCGSGHLVRALADEGFEAAGVEVSQEAAANAAARTGRPVYSLTDPSWKDLGPWDCIHLGDVIEHLPAPREALEEFAAMLEPGATLSAEGPLETNPSLVYWVAHTNNWLKRSILGRGVGSFTPFHLILTDAAAQRTLFESLRTPLNPVLWEVTETGWPYIRNGAMRNAIAVAAIGLAGLPGIGRGMGNRFAALYRRG